MNSHELFVLKKFKIVSNLIPPNSKVLDIGSNNGEIRKFLKFPNYFSIDGDRECVNSLIKQKIKSKLIDLNKEELPFKNEKFDYILLLDILEHVVDPKKLLDEARDKLNPKGKLIVTLPNDYHILNKIRFILNKHLTENPFAPHGHLHYFPIKSGEQFLKINNFKILEKIYLSPVKPEFVPQLLKDSLTKLFPQSFARDTLYLLN